MTPSKLLDAGIAEQASQLGTLVLPPPAQTVRLISGVQWREDDTWQTEECENVGVLLHQPSVAEMRKGVLFLDSKRLLEAAERLLPRFRSMLCKRLHLNLTTRTSWPSRSLENMVAAKFKRMKNRPIANRGMPPCVASVLSRKEPLTYQLRFQLAEVFSYTSLEFLREVLAPRLEIDGKTRHKNVEACFHVARKKRQTEGPITRTGVSGLYCVYGAGENGVKECAARMGYTGNIEEVSISQMWGTALKLGLLDPLLVTILKLVQADAVVKGGQNLLIRKYSAPVIISRSCFSRLTMVYRKSATKPHQREKPPSEDLLERGDLSIAVDVVNFVLRPKRVQNGVQAHHRAGSGITKLLARCMTTSESNRLSSVHSRHRAAPMLAKTAVPVLPETDNVPTSMW